MNPLAGSEIRFPVDLAEPWASIRIADAPDLFFECGPRELIVDELDLVFNDVDRDEGGLKAPTFEQAKAIWDFAEKNRDYTLIIQCPTGCNRSVAVKAAIARAHEYADIGFRLQGCYSHRLYELILHAAGIELPKPPLVSMAIHATHAPEYLLAFMLCMQRQRHPRWEVVATIDDHEKLTSPEWLYILSRWGDDRLRLIPVADARKRWGHQHRQKAIDACRGDFIGMSNSDNYYVPGYLEQMVLYMEATRCDMAISTVVHNYANWSLVSAGSDLGSFVAKADLVRRVKWHGEEHNSDQRYIKRLADAAKMVVGIERPLFVHN